MSIDLRSETLHPFRSVPALPGMPLRRGRDKLHVSTLVRWRKHGVRGVRLGAVRAGGTLCTSVEALQRFFERLAGSHSVSASPSPVCTPSAAPTGTNGNHDAAVERRLDELGLGAALSKAGSVEPSARHPAVREAQSLRGPQGPTNGGRSPSAVTVRALEARGM